MQPNISTHIEAHTDFNKNIFSVEVQHIFSNHDRIESKLEALGINNTNFWSLAAPRIQAGIIDIKPVIILFTLMPCKL